MSCRVLSLGNDLNATNEELTYLAGPLALSFRIALFVLDSRTFPKSANFALIKVSLGCYYPGQQTAYVELALATARR
jgi:hypothetical protein